MLSLKILGTPESKQSARFRAIKTGDGKSFIQSYQSKKVKDNERNIKFDVKKQLPEGFMPYDMAIGCKVLFVFPPLKSWSKKKIAELDSGITIHKDTKPDLTDNLMKGLFDAMQGIIFTDDSRVCKVESSKIYGIIPRIEVYIYPLIEL